MLLLLVVECIRLRVHDILESNGLVSVRIQSPFGFWNGAMVIGGKAPDAPVRAKMARAYYDGKTALPQLVVKYPLRNE